MASTARPGAFALATTIVLGFGAAAEAAPAETGSKKLAAMEAEASALYDACMQKLRSDLPRDEVMSCFNVYDMMAARLRAAERGDPVEPSLR